MPTVQEVWQDPDFHKLPPTEKAKVMQAIDSDFAALPTGEQNKVVFQLSNRSMLPQTSVIAPDGRQSELGQGAQMTPQEASVYAVNRAAFAQEGGASTFGGAKGGDTRKISYTGSGYKPNEKPRNLKDLTKNAVQNVVELPMAPVQMLSSLANAPDTGKAALDIAKAPLGFVPYVAKSVTGKTALENWGENPVYGALTVAPLVKGLSMAKGGMGRAVETVAGKLDATPESLARSALKPYIGESVARQKQAAKGIATAVADKNAVARMPQFLKKNLAEMEQITGRQDVLLNEKGDYLAPLGEIRTALQETIDHARETPGTADAAASAAAKVLEDIANHPKYDPVSDSIPIATMQTMKKNIWAKLRDGNTFNKDAVPGLQDAMWDAATGINKVINEFIPEMATENARYGELANVNKLLKRSIDRHSNNNIVPLRTVIQLVRGDVQGFATGASMWALDHPTFKMYIAQRMAKAKGGKTPSPKDVNSMVNSIKAALTVQHAPTDNTDTANSNNP